MGGGNNAGMRAADGRYFFLLNSDAWVVGDGLDELVEFADEHPEAAVVGPKLLQHRRHAAALGARRADAVAARDRVPVHPQARAALAAAQPALRRRLRPRRGGRGRLAVRPRAARAPRGGGRGRASSTRTSSCSARRSTG